MSTKIMWLTAVFFVTALLITGCSFPGTKQPPKQVATSTPKQVATSTSEEEILNMITYLISEEDETKYCNGSATDDSEAYRKTLNKEIVTDISADNLTQEELVRETTLLAVAGTEMCQTAIEPLVFKIVDGVVRIPPISGWAGLSVVMCSCKPRVEVNLLRIPGITKVMWLGIAN